jgi:rsbT antagonist protein RsbS
MPVPILKQADTLIACVQEAMSDNDLSKLKDDLTNRIGLFHSSGVIIDVSAVDVLDSFAARTLRDIAESSRLRGAETVIVGIHPDVAVAMVRLGLKLDGIASAHDLEDGLDAIARRAGRGRRRDR